MSPSLYSMAAVLLGLFFFARAIMNLNQIHMRTKPLIGVLNLALMLGGLWLALAPSRGVADTLAAALVVLVVFAVCTLIGRRPGDKVLGGQS